MTRKKQHRKIKSVTKMPCFILKLQGKLDSRKGDSVATARIAKLKDRCAAIENLECLEMEYSLFGAREQAAETLSALDNTKKDIPIKSEPMSPLDVHKLREEAKKAQKKRESQAKAAELLKRLYQIREILTHGDAELEERILKIRKKALVKIDAYVKGLRSSKLPDFEPDIMFCNDASSTYHAQHSALDNKICQIASYEEEQIA